MGFLKGLSQFVNAAGKQVTRKENLWKYEEDKQVIRYGNKFNAQAKALRLSESHALDVYYHGISLGDGKMVKKYNGYEIGIFYIIAPDSGVVIITWIWKRERR